jgi:hypothetical protein
MTRWLLGLLAALVVLAAGDARASVSIAVSWEGLLRESSVAVVATPVESRSVWEDGRIYTYTQVRVERALAGDLKPGDGAWVRTMGGVVGKIGQLVDGEAVLNAGQSSLLFLHPGPVTQATTYEVTARGQGQFPLVVDAKSGPRLVRSTSAGALVAPRLAAAATPPRLAADVVHGRVVDDVAREVASAWGATHGK